MRKTLLITDVVDSTALTAELGDEKMSKVWVEHDRICRQLLRTHNGTEAGRTDGFLMLFDNPERACHFAIDLHQHFQELSQKLQLDFQARIGIHTGEIILINQTKASAAAAGKSFEVEGIAKPATARVMSLARGGQTLLSKDAVTALEASSLQIVSHGHWRMKGIAEPAELFEVGTEQTSFQPPSDIEKVYRAIEIWCGRNRGHRARSHHTAWPGSDKKQDRVFC